jgi:LacI family transcriptional regulator
MRVRIEDVAAAAGVSMKTVSRVLNEEPRVSESTRQRVREAVERLQYKPSLSARSLAGQRSYMVALAYDNPSRNYLMEIQRGVLDACHAQHYTLVLAPVTYGDGRTIAELDELARHTAVDGFILTPPLTDDMQLLAHFDEQAMPFASIAPRIPRGRIGVTLDEHNATCELMAHLVALGHRRIAHIKGPPSHGAAEWRHAGYREGLRNAGIAYDPTLTVNGAFTFESGVAGANRLLDLEEPPTAIFAGNDDTAAGVLRVAGERGLKVPLDLSICGFDDTPLSRHTFPALTTVRQPGQDMGRVATMELLRAIRAPDAGDMVQMDYTLQLRESTGPVKGR